MPDAKRTIAVLGDGGWGTAMALHAVGLGHRVRLWGAFPEYVKLLARRRENVKFLPGIPLPKALRLSVDLREALSGADLAIIAIPSQHLRSVMRRVRPALAPRTPVLSLSKGLEAGTQQRMSQVILSELRDAPLAVLSGPNIAREIASRQPAMGVIAAREPRLAARLQRQLTSDRFRLYTSTDVTGVELGGALKNPIAIAAGISDGLGFGANAKAALVTRGVVEMARLGVAMGGREETFWGLTGLGDLVTTCLAGRNHWLGEQLAQGRKLRAILGSTPMVIEGVETSRAAVAWAARHRIDIPIIEQVHAILFKRRPPRMALSSLMRRDRKPESHR
jgi:glycerol-3-phosphate dehydrogenase (NAD(P)+)